MKLTENIHETEQYIQNTEQYIQYTDTYTSNFAQLLDPSRTYQKLWEKGRVHIPIFHFHQIARGVNEAGQQIKITD